jgi:hypothetical protein
VAQVNAEIADHTLPLHQYSRGTADHFIEHNTGMHNGSVGGWWPPEGDVLAGHLRVQHLGRPRPMCSRRSAMWTCSARSGYRALLARLLQRAQLAASSSRSTITSSRPWSWHQKQSLLAGLLPAHCSTSLRAMAPRFASACVSPRRKFMRGSNWSTNHNLAS